MVSLNLQSKDPRDILKYVYLCLGKKSLSLQDLVFYISFDLKLFPPEVAEKLITTGKNQGLIKVSKSKVATFDLAALEGQETGGVASLPVIIKELAATQDELDKAFGIGGNRVKSINFDPQGQFLKGEFTTIDGDPIEVFIDGKKRVVSQQLDKDEEKPANDGKKFFKYLIKAVLHANKEHGTGFTSIVKDIFDNTDRWKFEYK